jgi:hypothetical protein
MKFISSFFFVSLIWLGHGFQTLSTGIGTCTMLHHLTNIGARKLHSSKSEEVSSPIKKGRAPPSFAAGPELSVAKSSEEQLLFAVLGEPVALQRHRTTKFGMTYNPSAKMQEQFLEASETALKHLAVPLEGPLEVRLSFYFPRPKNHYGSGKNAHVLKPGMDVWHNKRKGRF